MSSKTRQQKVETLAANLEIQSGLSTGPPLILYLFFFLSLSPALDQRQQHDGRRRDHSPQVLEQQQQRTQQLHQRSRGQGTPEEQQQTTAAATAAAINPEQTGQLHRSVDVQDNISS